MKKTIFINIIILFSISVFSQKIFKDNPPKSVYYQPIPYIFDIEFEHKAEIYKEQIKQNPEDADINFKLAYCLLNSEKEKFNSIELFRKAIQTHDKEKSEIPFIAAQYYLGKALYLNYEFDSAIEIFSKLLLTVQRKKIIEIINNDILLCQNAKTLKESQEKIVVSKLGLINTQFKEHSLIMSANESVYYFTSNNEGDENIYKFNKKDGFDAAAEKISPPVNSESHDATCGISVSGQEIFIYRSNLGSGDIYYSRLDGTKWTTPERLNKNINTSKRETHASLSSDGNYLYFTSDRKGGFGGLDIYVSKKEENGTWGTAKNLGKNINTAFDEESPCIHPDGKTLYFSSKGHNTLGGFDIFFSTAKKAGSWQKAVNMGYPVNTTENELYYFPSADGLRGYFTLSSGNVNDIYSAQNYEGQEKNLAIVSGKAANTTEIASEFYADEVTQKGDTLILPSGRKIFKDGIQEQGDSVVITYREISDDLITVSDSIYYVPDNTQIYIIEVNTGELVANYSPNSVTGEYLFVLKTGNQYKLYYDSPNHIFDTENLSIIEDSSFVTHDYNAQLQKIEKGKINKFKQTPFEENETYLNITTKLELDLLVHFLKKNSQTLVNVSGYDYLLQDSDPNFLPPSFLLAPSRCDSIINYLVLNGISKERIFTGLSPNMIFGDVIEYTILDEITLLKAQELKKDRLAIYKEALSMANIAEDEINEVYGDESDSEKETVVVHDMLFEINKATAGNKYEKNLKTLADYLKNNKEAVIEVIGYTDLQGPASFNKQLSKKRAEFVRNDLIQKGADKDRVILKYFSGENPISRNKMSNGEFDMKSLVYNRRVEIIVKNQGEKEILKIQKIEVPKEFKVGMDFNPDAFSYSINLMTSDNPIPLVTFEGILEGVKEKKDKDKTYIYYYGSYKTEEEAQEQLEEIRQNFPESFVFIKDF